VRLLTLKGQPGSFTFDCVRNKLKRYFTTGLDFCICKNRQASTETLYRKGL